MSEHQRSWHALILALLLTAGPLAASAGAGELDDPMRPTPTPPPTSVPTPAPEAPEPARPAFDPAAYQLTALYQVGEIKRARINGQWYVEQDNLAPDVVLTHIEADRIRLRTPDGTHELELERRRAQFSSPHDAGPEARTSAPDRSEEAR